ncbi:D-alanyl-D-alanine carboxypeptidase [Paenibacillus selenitireducens]|uniref:D-alanyl-D-alanine carboxypeptidase n=1 Tax=Paenibacillus selenitireducens TaxID=1324314 RepID=A0A1T2X2C5_9BACL|nr:D-alanyl-D-alanine carboxypeptidase family protein [Paenibacillus selenitireducens]OPA73987.1 D-alanyl-D-alanine carboxypeptidase [Paenibacillus selenitireducens]
MMKIKFITGFSVISAICSVLFLKHIDEPSIHAQAALLIDASTGEVFYEKNADTPLAAASMSKMMTEYLVLEQLHQGRLKWEDEVAITDYAANTDGVRIQLHAGEQVTVQDLYAAMLIPSANNAAVALAEHIAGSEAQFTARMNEKGQELGLENSNFINATGLTEGNQASTMTAKDLSKLAQALLRDFPEVLETTSLPTYTLGFSGERIQSTNHMLLKQDLAVEGLDGLKTGYTNKAGYCFTGTASRDGRRFITVVMGTSDSDERFVETQKLFALGFHTVYIPSFSSILLKVKEIKEQWV